MILSKPLFSGAGASPGATEETRCSSPKIIACELNRDGVPSPGGTGWTQSTINGNRRRGTGILNNELYVGVLVWNRLR